eukprot:gb/GECG01008228.1/.p1 GENE.gb/GECG01008228.1/~~gb/GECG01008228.1/.p1  ORF type:complete len:357 (+),score=32.00 gb/GECG01008228.1/:1-1071(+)
MKCAKSCIKQMKNSYPDSTRILNKKIPHNRRVLREGTRFNMTANSGIILVRITLCVTWGEILTLVTACNRHGPVPFEPTRNLAELGTIKTRVTAVVEWLPMVRLATQSRLSNRLSRKQPILPSIRTIPVSSTKNPGTTYQTLNPTELTPLSQTRLPKEKKTGVGRLAGSSGPIYQKGSSSGNTFGWDGTKGGSLDASPSPGEPPSLNTSASSVDSYVQRAKERLADYIGTSNWNQQGGSGGTKAVSFGLAKRNQDQQQHQLDLDDWLPIRRTNEDSNARLAAAEEKHTGRSAQAKQRGRSSPSRSLRRTTVSTEMKRSPKAVKKRSSSAKGKLKKPTSPQFSVSKKKRCQSQILGT